MKKYKNIILTSITFVVILVVLAVVFRPAENSGQSESLSQDDSIVLAAEESFFDFGEISMANGVVTHEFKIKNTSGEAVVINKMYTSCMCTTAKLMVGNKQFGPYGMPGHGAAPIMDQMMNPNDEAIIEVIFDPAAHGPAGVGKIQRVVTIENSAGQSFELSFAALVTP